MTTRAAQLERSGVKSGRGAVDRISVSAVRAPARVPRALVVEDDPDVGALIGSHLRRLGCAVTLVTTGEEAIARAASDRPDLAVVDIVLPGIDGREVIDVLRSRSGSPCFVVSASVLDPKDVGRECDATLTKPFGKAEIERALRPLLGERRGGRRR